MNHIVRRRKMTITKAEIDELRRLWERAMEARIPFEGVQSGIAITMAEKEFLDKAHAAFPRLLEIARKYEECLNLYCKNCGHPFTEEIAKILASPFKAAQPKEEG
jgi:hypothetical protein